MSLSRRSAEGRAGDLEQWSASRRPADRLRPVRQIQGQIGLASLCAMTPANIDCTPHLPARSKLESFARHQAFEGELGPPDGQVTRDSDGPRHWPTHWPTPITTTVVLS